METDKENKLWRSETTRLKCCIFLRPLETNTPHRGRRHKVCVDKETTLNQFVRQTLNGNSNQMATCFERNLPHSALYCCSGVMTLLHSSNGWKCKVCFAEFASDCVPPPTSPVIANIFLCLSTTVHLYTVRYSSVVFQSSLELSPHALGSPASKGS